jgi:hypothetical protein
MIHGQLAEVHAEPRDEPVQDQLQEGDQQHELDRVLKEERLIAQLSGDAFNGCCGCRHARSDGG